MKIPVEKSLTIQKTAKKNCKINWRTNQAVFDGLFLSSWPTLGWMRPVYWRRFPSPATHDHGLHKGSTEKWRYLHTHTVPSACQLPSTGALVHAHPLHPPPAVFSLSPAPPGLLKTAHLLKSLLATWYHLAGDPQSLHYLATSQVLPIRRYHPWLLHSTPIMLFQNHHNYKHNSATSSSIQHSLWLPWHPTMWPE